LTQDDIFWEGEGNKWFTRNETSLLNEEYLSNDLALRVLDLAKLEPQDVLEIGASNGVRLHALHSRFNCCVTAVDPSQEAIKDGRVRYPAINFLRGVASDLPVETGRQFDLVIIYFVLHWIDRSTLFRSVAEIDRVLKDGGYLIVGDFLPYHPQRVTYHHLPEAEVWTYKQDYARIFLASNLYDLVTFIEFDHASHQIELDGDPDNRAQVALLRKRVTDRYRIMDYKP